VIGRITTDYTAFNYRAAIIIAEDSTTPTCCVANEFAIPDCWVTIITTYSATEVSSPVVGDRAVDNRRIAVIARYSCSTVAPTRRMSADNAIDNGGTAVPTADSTAAITSGVSIYNAKTINCRVGVFMIKEKEAAV
jgi:hypothetical protein